MDNQVEFVSLPTDKPIWDRVYTVAPLVVIGSREADGRYNLAPKHLAMPLSWENNYGFICTPSHGTYDNIQREGVFTVSFPRPTQALLATLAAAPRDEIGRKPALTQLETIPARKVDGRLLQNAYFCLECELDRIIDGFGDNSLIAGQVVAAMVAADSLRDDDVSDHDLLNGAPLLAYVDWGRYARIDETYPFPFVAGFSR